MSSLTIELADSDETRTLAGPQNEHFKIVERRLGVRIGQRGNSLTLSGDEGAVEQAAHLVERLAGMAQAGKSISRESVEQSLKILSATGDAGLKAMASAPVLTRAGGRQVTSRSLAQQQYVDLISSRDVVFGIGPAGTGKTYLAMAMAVAALQERRVKKIVLARPAVEAGEKLGFLPGDLAEKVNPYLQPLYDALNDMMEGSRARDLIEQGVIEVAPLAFMRGRTLNDSFAILDEAQNTTVEQMKMFLTRIGYHSKAVITGDPTQVDLPPGKQSGLIHARSILGGIEGIGFAEFSDVDVVRHPLVAEVIRAYAREGHAPVEPAPSPPRRGDVVPPLPRGDW